jgi:hypothetical protein
MFQVTWLRKTQMRFREQHYGTNRGRSHLSRLCAHTKWCQCFVLTVTVARSRITSKQSQHTLSLLWRDRSGRGGWELWIVTLRNALLLCLNIPYSPLLSDVPSMNDGVRCSIWTHHYEFLLWRSRCCGDVIHISRLIDWSICSQSNTRQGDLLDKIVLSTMLLLWYAACCVLSMKLIA